MVRYRVLQRGLAFFQNFSISSISETFLILYKSIKLQYMEAKVI